MFVFMGFGLRKTMDRVIQTVLIKYEGKSWQTHEVLWRIRAPMVLVGMIFGVCQTFWSKSPHLHDMQPLKPIGLTILLCQMFPSVRMWLIIPSAAGAVTL